MLSSVCIGHLVVLWTGFANSKANVCVEIYLPQEITAVEPIIVSTCRCFERCDIQIILQGFDIAAIIQGLRNMLLILVVDVNDRFGLNRQYSTVGIDLNAMRFRRLRMSGRLQMIGVCIFGGSTVMQNVVLL